jgi:CheY-like chemotaxis protein
MRVRLRRLLEDNGYAVSTATTGKLALRELELPPAPSLILVDLYLPMTDGRSFTGILREHADWSKIPIVLLSPIELEPVEGTLPALRRDASDDDVLRLVARYCR